MTNARPIASAECGVARTGATTAPARRIHRAAMGPCAKAEGDRGCRDRCRHAREQRDGERRCEPRLRDKRAPGVERQRVSAERRQVAERGQQRADEAGGNRREEGGDGQHRRRAQPARRPGSAHFVYRFSQASAMRVIHDGCGSSSAVAELGVGGQGGRARKILERLALGRGQPGKVEHGEVAHLPDSPARTPAWRARAGNWRRPSRPPCSRRCTESRRSSCCRWCRARTRPYARSWQEPRVDRDGRLRRSERHHDVDLAIVQELALRGAVVGKLRALAPEVRDAARRTTSTAAP